MSKHLRFGRFDFQVRLVLVLLVLFLAALDVVNLLLLDRSRRTLDRAERQRVEAQAMQVVDALGGDALLRALVARGSGEPAGPGSATMRRAAVRFGFVRAALLDQAGREVAASGSAEADAPNRFFELGPDDRAALAAGRPIAVEPEPRRNGEDARLTAYVPLLDTTGRLLGSIEATSLVPGLGALRANFAIVVVVQLAGVLAIGAILLFFANWVSRPYRRLAAAAGEAGWAGEEKGSGAEPDDLVSAFRGIVGKLREQDAAVEALGQEGSGLGVAVRFASNAALSMATGVLVLDRQARVAAMNAAAAALLGCEREEARGHPFAELPGAAESFRALVRACLEQGRSASREVLEIPTEEGRPHYLGVSVNPATGMTGEIAGVLVLMSDLTEIRQLQEQARLRENLAAVGQLSAGIAHEFRNALGTILGYARILEKQPDARVRGPVREILKEIDSVRSVVDEFLLYARPPDPDPRLLQLGPLLRKAVAAAPERIEVEVKGEFGLVLADEALLRRVFGNLLQNAADAAADHGRKLQLTISGRRHPSARTLQIEVEDDGPGIPAELRDRVFVPFFTTRTKGTGLGLALVQRTLVDLGGSVEAAAGAKGGALFRIRLPLASVEPERTRLDTPARATVSSAS